MPGIFQGNDQDVLDDEARFENAEYFNNGLEMNALRLSSTKARLVLPCVTSHHEGEYTCVAETPYKRISTTTIIEVGELHAEYPVYIAVVLSIT